MKAKKKVVRKSQSSLTAHDASLLASMADQHRRRGRLPADGGKKLLNRLTGSPFANEVAKELFSMLEDETGRASRRDTAAAKAARQLIGWTKAKPPKPSKAHAFSNVEEPKLDGAFMTGPLPGGPSKHLPPPRIIPPPKPPSPMESPLVPTLIAMVRRAAGEVPVADLRKGIYADLHALLKQHGIKD